MGARTSGASRSAMTLVLGTVLVLTSGVAGCGPSGPDGPASPTPSPTATQPTATQPTATQPTATTPRPTQPTPTTPRPTQPTPTTPRPSSPTPTAPSTATPTAPSTASPSALPEALAGRVLGTLPTPGRVVALTFDGGASDTGVPRILATLAQHGVTATFFVTGDFARRYPDRVAAIAAAGHRIGNHSDTHPDFTTLDRAGQVRQLSRAEATIAPLAGSSTAPWFRFPFGASSSSAISTVNSQGYSCIGWTVDTLGWQGTRAGRSVASVTARVLDTARPGQIVLMHVGANPDDGSTLDADALGAVVDGLRALGYGFVTLDAALA